MADAVKNIKFKTTVDNKVALDSFDQLGQSVQKLNPELSKVAVTATLLNSGLIFFTDSPSWSNESNAILLSTVVLNFIFFTASAIRIISELICLRFELTQTKY